MDDGSTDRTTEAVTSAFDRDDRLRIIRLVTNRGRGAARAAGLKPREARRSGSWTPTSPFRLTRLERCLAELPGNAAVSGIPVPDGDASVIAQVSGATPRVVGGGMPITGSNVLFDAKVLAEVGFDPGIELARTSGSPLASCGVVTDSDASLA